MGWLRCTVAFALALLFAVGTAATGSPAAAMPDDPGAGPRAWGTRHLPTSRHRAGPHDFEGEDAADAADRLDGPLTTSSTGPGAGPGPNRPPATYVVEPGDTLGGIAQEHGVSSADLARWNGIDDPTRIRPEQVLRIAGSDGRLPTPEPAPTRPAPAARLSPGAANADTASPLRDTTWVTYYGRPGVPIMGVLGEHDIDGLVPLLRKQASDFDQLNGELGVTPAFHLIYGMASKSPGADGDHLVYLPDEVVQRYLERARKEGFGLILDVQIGARTPVEAVRPVLPWLRHPEVHVALDPEFAVSDGQAIPGRPPGWVSGPQINAVQALISAALPDRGPGPDSETRPSQRAEAPNHGVDRKMLIVHQFQPAMIRDRGAAEAVDPVDLVFVMDGFGPPATKVNHYNGFVAPGAPFTGFKLFYRWDTPVMTEAEVLGRSRPNGSRYMEITPNVVIYQ